ncbi:MAG: hypothetical protein WA708_04300 [Acidobacteriaceae bacterium]
MSNLFYLPVPTHAMVVEDYVVPRNWDVSALDAAKAVLRNNEIAAEKEEAGNPSGFPASCCVPVSD